MVYLWDDKETTYCSTYVAPDVAALILSILYSILTFFFARYLMFVIAIIELN